MSKYYLPLLLSLAYLLCASAVVHAQETNANNPISAVLSSKRDNYLQQKDLSAEVAVLQSLYQQRNFSLLWLINGQATASALDMLQVLRNADSYGLRAANYDGIALSYRLNELASMPESEARQTAMAQLDVALSAASLRFIRHIHYGRIDPRKAGFDFDIQRSREFDPLASLTTLAASKQVAADIARLEPQLLHYQLLKRALAQYRLLAVDAELTQLPPLTARSIKPGESYVGAAALRRLLVAERDFANDAVASDKDITLDPALVAALKRYQTRHGLPADGAIGKQTFAALTTPFANRVQQIELTLERWRWLPQIQSPMIVVNIPQFKLFAFKANDDREANLLRMNVIVGQAFPHTQTPIFLADMKYVVFRPYWDVPYNITQRELLPQIHRSSEYLQRNHFELVRGQGDNSPVMPASPENIAQLASGALRVRQQPGNDNALGDIKFMLPNTHNVYLHSTPAKRLFNETQRAFSHGCIRVSDPVALAEYVLRNTAEEWSAEKIQAAMQGEPNQRVNLTKSIPVMIVYGTAMPNEAGQVQFFNDIYGYDRKLAKLVGN